MKPIRIVYNKRTGMYFSSRTGVEDPNLLRAIAAGVFVGDEAKLFIERMNPSCGPLEMLEVGFSECGQADMRRALETGDRILMVGVVPVVEVREATLTEFVIGSSRYLRSSGALIDGEGNLTTQFIPRILRQVKTEGDSKCQHV